MKAESAADGNDVQAGLTDFYMVNINVADLPTSMRFYEQLGFREILRMDVTDPSVGHTYGVDDFKLARLVWMRLSTARSHRWPVLDLVQFVDPPMLIPCPGDGRRRQGPSRISFRVDGIDAVQALYDEFVQRGLDVVVPLTRRDDPGGRPLALFWLRDPDGTVIEVIHVAPA